MAKLLTLRFILLLSIGMVGQQTASSMPIFKMFNDGNLTYLGADLSRESAFKNENSSLGITLGKVDFEVLPDGNATGNLAATGGTYGNSVTFQYMVPSDVTISTTVPNSVYPNGSTKIEGGYGVSVSGVYTEAITTSFASPVASSGIWLIDIDNFISGPDAFATWHFADGSDFTVFFDTNFNRPKNQFFSLITYTDSTYTEATNSIIGFAFGELGGNATYADNLYVGAVGGSLVPYPPVLPPPCDTCNDPPTDPPSVIPEPATLTLVGVATLGLVAVRRRKVEHTA